MGDIRFNYRDLVAPILLGMAIGIVIVVIGFSVLVHITKPPPPPTRTLAATYKLKLRDILLGELTQTQMGDARDFLRYACGHMVRVGGSAHVAARLSDPLYRLDGAWFLCMDAAVQPPEPAHCTVVSAIRRATTLLGTTNATTAADDAALDASFDAAMAAEPHRCVVHSFVRHRDLPQFDQLRRRGNVDGVVSLTVLGNSADEQSGRLKWHQHRLGLVSLPGLSTGTTFFDGAATLHQLLAHAGLRNRVVDVLRLQLDYAEWDVLNALDMDHACVYVKQLLVETHTWNGDGTLADQTQFDYNQTLSRLRRLEKCFSLYRRDLSLRNRSATASKVYDQYGNIKSEFQPPVSYQLELAPYKSEINVLNMLIQYGQLHFVNIGFFL